MSQWPQTPCPRSKAATGCLLCRGKTLCRICQPELYTSVDNLNQEEPQGFYTGSYWLLRQNAEDQNSSPFSEKPLMSSSPDPVQQMNTSGKKTPELQGHNLNSEASPSTEQSQKTGTGFEHWLFKEALMKSHLTFSFVVTTNCAELAKTTYDQLLWSAPAQFSGAEPGLVSRSWHGNKLLWMPTLKIQDPSSGTVTEIMNMWSWMNFEVSFIKHRSHRHILLAHLARSLSVYC